MTKDDRMRDRIEAEIRELADDDAIATLRELAGELRLDVVATVRNMITLAAPHVLVFRRAQLGGKYLPVVERYCGRSRMQVVQIEGAQLLFGAPLGAIAVMAEELVPLRHRPELARPSADATGCALVVAAPRADVIQLEVRGYLVRPGLAPVGSFEERLAISRRPAVPEVA